MNTTKIQLHGKYGNGKFALVDAEDFEFLNSFRWYAKKSHSGSLYAARGVRTVRMHQLIVDATDGQFVDHKNRDTLDNRRENLRACTRSENARNRTATKSKNGYKGVYLVKNRPNKPWRALIVMGNKRLSLGMFYTAQEAALAYNRAAKDYFGEFACLNEIGG